MLRLYDTPHHNNTMTIKLFKILLKCILGFLLISFAWVLLYRFIPIAGTPLMAIRCIEQAINPKQEIRFHKDWVAIEKISPHLITAVIAAEDQLFLQHHGFDIVAIKKALSNNSKKTRSRIKGASTISQQTAKNAFLWPHRDWVRKGLEAYFTVLIELLWSKERIMEVYLNVIEMGDGVYGAQGAAQYYFHKDASKISRYEAASIAAILPNPIRWSANKPSQYIHQRIYWIERQMYNLGKIDLDPDKK